jgi:hypothetical protein
MDEIQLKMCIKLNKLSYQIMQKIKIKIKSMILEDDINKVKWMTLKFMERKMFYFICCQ